MSIRLVGRLVSTVVPGWFPLTSFFSLVIMLVNMCCVCSKPCFLHLYCIVIRDLFVNTVLQ